MLCTPSTVLEGSSSLIKINGYLTILLNPCSLSDSQGVLPKLWLALSPILQTSTAIRQFLVKHVTYVTPLAILSRQLYTNKCRSALFLPGINVVQGRKMSNFSKVHFSHWTANGGWGHESSQDISASCSQVSPQNSQIGQHVHYMLIYACVLANICDIAACRCTTIHIASAPHVWLSHPQGWDNQWKLGRGTPNVQQPSIIRL